MLATLILSTVAAPPAWAKTKTVGVEDQAITVAAQPITQFEKAAPEHTRFGQLQWRGGMVLTSPSTYFGGWSALALDPDGRLLAISDTGVWMTGRLTYEGTRPVGIEAARLGPLRSITGQSFTRARDQDSEGVALVSGTLTQGEVLVSFERNHRILRFPVTTEGLGRSVGDVALPAEARQLTANKSLEAVCQVKAGPAAGSILTFAERHPSKGDLGTGWIRPPLADGASRAASAAQPAAWRQLSVQVVDGYDFTDCAGAPDGSILLLERRFRLKYGDPLTGPRMRIRRFSPDELATAATTTATLNGETLLEAAREHDIDNMEGLAVHVDKAGETILTLISDDNFNHLLQRTVLLQFVLKPTAPKPTASKVGPPKAGAGAAPAPVGQAESATAQPAVPASQPAPSGKP